MKIIYLIAAAFFTFLFKGQVFSQCTATIAGDTAVCQGGDSLLITFTGSNGTAPYTFIYNINGGSDTSVTTTGSSTTITIAAPADSAGTFFYNLDSVADANGCLEPQTGSVTITVYALPTALISGSTNVCQNEVSPLIVFTGADGLQNYNFSYHINSGLNNTITTNSSDTVSVTVPTSIPGIFIYHLDSVSDEHSCYRALQDSATVIVDSLPIAILSGNQTVCQNNPTAITFNGSNGTPPFTFKYFIDGIQNTIISSGNSISVSVATNNPGIYVYLLDSVFNSNGCSQKQPDTATITVHPLPSAAISGTITVCRDSGATTPVTFTGSNGTPPYTFYYNINSGPPLVISTSGNNSVKIKNASIGAGGTFVYNLDSVSDANGCLQVISGSATITVNFLPIGTINGNATVCQNDSSPLITFSGYNGTSPFIFYYQINNGPPLNIATSGSNTVTVAVPTNNPGIFVYHLDSVSNSNNCFKALGSDSVTITVNPLPTGLIIGDTAVCQNAPSPFLTFTGHNGRPPYTFTYNINAGNSQTITTNSSDSIIPVPVATNTPGTFIYNLISVSDSNGCWQNQPNTATIIIHPLPTATITGDTTVCSSPDSVPIIFTGSNGTAPYTFYYSILGVPQSPLTSSGTDTTINAPTDSAGIFIYTLNAVSDSNGCVQAININATIIVNQSLSAVITVQDNSGNSPNDGIICSGDSAILIASGGLTYSWSTGDSTAAITVGATGTYSVTVSLSGNCTSTSSVTITVNPLPTATISGSDTVCSSPGSIPVIFTGSNGTAPYTFFYSLNGILQPPLTSSGIDTINAPTDSPGTFVYTLNSVSDVNGCMQTINSSATIIVNQTLSAVITVQDNSGNSPNDGIICSGDSAILIASGGLTYSWSPNNESTATITVYTTGTYSVTVYLNDSICTSSDSVTITVNSLPNATISGTDTVCSSLDSIPVTFMGFNGTAPYTFIYSINGVSQPDLIASINDTTIYAQTNSHGTFVYTLISVSDSNGCSQAMADTVTITVNSLPSASITGDTIACADSSSTTPVTFFGFNGTQPYTFTYSINGVPQPDSATIGTDTSITINASINMAGTFIYTLISVLDSNGCSGTVTNQTATIIVHPLPSATIVSLTTHVCQNDTAVNITLTGSNGTLPYMFTYSINGSNQPAITTIGNNTSITVNILTNSPDTFVYTLNSVSDAYGCTSVINQSDTIIVNPLPTATITASDTVTVVCQYDFAGPLITFTGSVGPPPYTFTYSINGVNQDDIETSGPDSSISINAPTSAAGIFNYTLISVEDSNGCSQTITNGDSINATILVHPAPETPVFTALNSGTEITLCRGSANINFNITYPSDTVTYLWSLSSTGAGIGNVTNPNTVISFYDEGQIIITNTNSTGLGCQESSSMVVTVNNNDGFEERKIILKQPGNLLVYPDNSMDPSHYFGNVLINGYQWGYDSIADKASPLDSLGPPNEIPGQVYQVFVPVSKFINGNSLNETDYVYWVLLNKDGCQSRVYYNGPYKNNRLVPGIPVDNTVGASVFPNPTTGDLNIMLHGNIYGNIDVSIYNPLGQIVYKDNFEKKQFETIQNIQLNKIPEGIYLLELLSSDHQHVTTRIIIYH